MLVSACESGRNNSARLRSGEKRRDANPAKGSKPTNEKSLSVESLSIILLSSLPLSSVCVSLSLTNFSGTV